MVWITMSVAPHAGSKKRKKNDSKPHSQINKCLNEKRRREQENIHIEELAELLSASPSDMSSLSCKPDKCAILKETVNQIRSQKQSAESDLCDDLQQSEVSSSKPNIINNQIFGSILLEALEGFLFVVNIDGKVEFVSENIVSFLKYHQEEVFEKNIYDFIHPDDRARFNSNLLLMMPIGDGRDWSAESNFNSTKLTKHFNCRFLVHADESEVKMENKQPRVPQYENLNITANYIPLGDEGSDSKNGLTCIARRVAVEDKRVGVNKVEQFTTRIDREGKVVDLDIGMLSPTSDQYLRKELLGSAMLDFCHPGDLPTLKQHLKETLENGVSICSPFKFRIGRDKYAKVKTKSKRFQNVQGVGEFIISTHSIIRDSDSSTAIENQKSISSPSSIASTSSGPGSVSDSSTSVNGSVALSPLSVSNSYGNFTSTSQNNADFRVSELVLDMFPSSSWSLDQNSSQMKENDSISGFTPSPQTVPLSSRSSDTSAASSPTNNAFVTNVASNRTASSVPSPVVQSRTPTPFGGSCYSPSAPQSSSERNSPAHISLADNSGNSNINQILRQDRQFDAKNNQKLRNLLTQSVEESSRLVQRQSSQDEVTVIGETRFEDSSHLSLSNMRDTSNVSKPATSNVILRDLLNQDDDEVPLEPIFRHDVSVPNPLLHTGVCKAAESSVQQRLGNNNMLRKLLNDDTDRSFRKSQDIIHKLLIEGAGSKSFQNDSRSSNVQSSRVMEQSVPKSVSLDSFRGSSDVTFISESNALKRKIIEKPPNVLVKRQGGPHAHLAGQNPMLASMLAQTPRTPPTVPTSVASSIMTQLPQERLPKNLEKKLVHTPYTAVAVSGTITATSSQAFQNLLVTATNQKDIVTSDTRGHVVHTSQQMQFQPGIKTFPQQQQGIIDKLLATGNDTLARQLALSFPSSTAAQNPPTYVQVSQASNNVLSSTSLLTDPVLIPSDLTDPSTQNNQASSDPVLAELLEQIYSLQEEHNLQTPCTADDRATILKILEVIDSPQTSSSTQPTSSTSTEDLNEKIAISAIQKELMEEASLAVAYRTINQNIAGVSTYSQAGRPSTQVSGTPVLQAQLTAEQILLLQQQQQQQQQLISGSLPPNYNLISNRLRLPSSTQSQLFNNPDLLTQAQRRGIQIVRNTYVNLGNPSVRKTMKQKLYLQQQQKRLLEQQQKQQLTMQTQQPLDVINTAGSNSFPENMNDLLNNTVAPNVTLMRSSEVPGSTRFNLSLSNPVLSPTNQTSPSPQLSPGQRVTPRSPFSPLSQQAFQSQAPSPNSYQATGLSPHAPPSYSQGGPSQSPLPIPPTTSPHVVLSPQPSSSSSATSPQWNRQVSSSPIPNLQLQNPMLNAQLSQAPLTPNQQIRLTAQQRQQLNLRSLPNPTSLQSTRNSAITSQSEASFPPLSPVMVLQSQAQQRIQRTNSLSDRISGASQNQSNFTISESVLSPQSLPSPSFVASTPTSSVASIPSSPVVPLSFSSSQNSQHFNFERQNIQTFTNSSNDLNVGSPANVTGTSDILQAVASRNQISLSTANVLQSVSSNSNARVLNVQNLSRETLEELGLPLELLSGTDAQSTSQTLYSQALLNVSSSLENTSQQPVATSPRVQVEEPRPADRKKSLLQQLLSEPT